MKKGKLKRMGLIKRNREWFCQSTKKEINEKTATATGTKSPCIKTQKNPRETNNTFWGQFNKQKTVTA